MTKKEPLFQKLALIGIGLIGSSIAHACKRANVVGDIAIATRRADTLKEAERLGLGTSYHLRAEDAVKDADIVIICVPVGAYEAIAKTISPHLKEGAIISDVGSVKTSIIKQMAPHLPGHVHFIPGHPIAGTEYSGPASGFASLFDERWSILTPLEGADKQAVQKLTQFWEALGSKVDLMDANHHDLVLAITSHLPHLIAYNIVGTADDLEGVTQSEVIKYSASGFRDFTRIAASDPTMWRDVFLHNKEAVLEVLGRFSEDLAYLQRAIRWEEGDKLYDLFSRTRSIRRSILEAGQDIDAPDFGRINQKED